MEGKAGISADDPPPPEALAMYADLSHQAATSASYVNRVLAYEFESGLVALVFGYLAGFPGPEGDIKPRATVYPAVLMNRFMLKVVVEAIAQNYDIRADPPKID